MPYTHRLWTPKLDLWQKLCLPGLTHRNRMEQPFFCRRFSISRESSALAPWTLDVSDGWGCMNIGKKHRKDLPKNVQKVISGGISGGIIGESSPSFRSAPVGISVGSFDTGEALTPLHGTSSTPHRAPRCTEPLMVLIYVDIIDIWSKKDRDDLWTK